MEARSDWGNWRFIAAQWLPPILAIVMARSAVASPFHVPTGSMVPTVEVGDQILVSKTAYGLNVPWIRADGDPGLHWMNTREVVSWSDPSPGDVVLFRYPGDPSIDYLKRVVAVGGDEVSVQDGVPTVNGVQMHRTQMGRHDYLDANCHAHRGARFDEDLDGVVHGVLDTARSGRDFGPAIVPQGHLFVMGDNRDHSADSRYWGFLKRDRIRGRAVGVFSRNACDGDAWVGWQRL